MVGSSFALISTNPLGSFDISLALPLMASNEHATLTEGLLYDLRCCSMSQSEIRRATSTDAAPMSSAGVWRLL